MIKFFTLPPNSIPHKYILINARNPSISYIRRHRKYVEEIIIDSGIEIFRNPNITDYPKNWIYRLIKIYAEIKSIARNSKVYLTCPDYCDDYNPCRLWINDKITNIERTVENVLKYALKYNGINWLIVVQGHYNNPESVNRCIDLYEEYSIIDKFNYFAIGNLCVEKDVRKIVKTANIVRNRLGSNKKIHIFGMKMNAIKYLQHIIDSFDTMAWTRPITHRIGRWSCKTKRERELYFMEWIKSYKNKLNQSIINYI